MSEDNATLAAENEELRAKLGRAYTEYKKLRESHKELENDFQLLMNGKRKIEFKLGAINERYARDIKKLKIEHKREDLITAIFSATGGFMACAVIVWALIQFGGK